MKISLKNLFILPLILLVISCKAPGDNENTIISLKTSDGEIKIKLYDATPIHRDNFIKLINSGFYDGISFHRIIKDFMIQAGDPQTKSVIPAVFPDSLKTYTIPAEINPLYFHKKGALAAARQSTEINPDMRSSGTQFYIVQGVKYSNDEINQAEQRINSIIKQGLFNKLMHETADSVRASGNTATEGMIQEIASVKMFQYLTITPGFKFSDEQREVYMNIGGTPRLDGTYTVFGEVIEGLDIVDKIASAATDSNDKPLNDIKIIKIKIVRN